MSQARVLIFGVFKIWLIKLWSLKSLCNQELMQLRGDCLRAKIKVLAAMRKPTFMRK
jgi:hypothetical protein